MKPRLRFTSIFLLLAVACFRASHADELHFEIDRSRTELSLSGSLDESSLTPQDDAGQSAVTTASGFFTVYVDDVFAPTEIAFDDTRIVLSDSGDWLPASGGSPRDIPEPANFAMGFDDETGSGVGALRGFELSIFDFDAKPVDSTFVVPELLNIESGVLDFNAGGPFIGQINQAGILLVNESEELAIYEIIDDRAELTMPILIHSITTLDLTISGQIVAVMDIPERRGDFDRDGQLTISDIDALSIAIRNEESGLQWDLNSDGTISLDDLTFWVDDKMRTYVGDANLDGEFNSADLVNVFQSAEYEDGIDQNSTWATGDWNANGEFDSADFVAAFQNGGFEQGPRPVNRVPESSNGLTMVTLLFVFVYRRVVLGENLL